MTKNVHDDYNYVISIDLGSTFSGSCYTSIKDKRSIVHVTKWPHQSTTFEKTPSVCLYDLTQNPPKLIKWGQEAVDYAAMYPDDKSTLIVSEFKLKLFHSDATTTATASQYVTPRTAAIDFLQSIHTYTLNQFLEHNPTASATQIGYVLTMPATWINKDSEYLREIAIAANVIKASEKARVAVLSEAHAASLFCEREYCNTSTTQLYKGQRYAVVDVGGVTADIATYECTENEQGHCQLALESMDVCGSVILDRHMETYLEEQVFCGCADKRLVKLLVEQFKDKIKHHFGEDSNKHNNYMAPNEPTAAELDASRVIAVKETAVPTEMMDCQHDNVDYGEFNESCPSEDDSEGAFDYDPEDPASPMSDIEEDSNIQHDTISNLALMEQNHHVYLSLPPDWRNLVEPLIIENMMLKQDITESNQLRIRTKDIAQHVFDPVVKKVIALIHQQIKTSFTTIHTLFLLGGFGQSSYLQKKIHQEFITDTQTVQQIIVPEHGYRASMRGGIHYGLDCLKVIPEYHFKDQHGHLHKRVPPLQDCNTLVFIEFNFHEMKAAYSILSSSPSNAGTDEPQQFSQWQFRFEPNKFLEEHYESLETFTATHQMTMMNQFASTTAKSLIDGWIYFDMFITSFMQQLFDHLKSTRRNIHWPTTRYHASILRGSHPTAGSYARLKNHLAAKMSQSSKFSFESSNALSQHICDTLHKHSTSLLLEKARFMALKHKTSQVAKLRGIINESDPVERFSWNALVDDDDDWHRMIEYGPKVDSSSNNSEIQVFVFDLEWHSKIHSGRVEAWKIESNNIKMFHERQLYFFKNMAPGDITHPFTPSMVEQGVKDKSFTPQQLLDILGALGDIMFSQHIKTYIKNNVDLSLPDQTHSIKDMFMPSPLTTNEVVDIRYRHISRRMSSVLQQAIRSFSQDQTCTTTEIIDLLLLPWVTNVLVPAIRYAAALSLSRVVSYYLLFPGEIIQTKHSQQTSTASNNNCPLFHALKQTLTSPPITLDATSTNSRFNMNMRTQLGSVIQAAKLNHKRAIKRTARHTYAVHFLQQCVQKLEGPVPSAAMPSSSTDVYSSFLKKQQQMNSGKKNVEVTPDPLKLHPLIRQDADLVAECNAVQKLEFPVEHPCSLATVLYFSDDDPPLNTYYISNPSFNKLHRFIIPIQDPTQPVSITCTPENYSILFTVTQGDHYKADYRCNDFMYQC